LTDTTNSSPTLDTLLSSFISDYSAQFATARDEPSLREARAALLGKKGRLTELLRGMASVPPAQRKAMGERINAVKDTVEKAFATRLHELHHAAREAELHQTTDDLSLPGRTGLPRGSAHPILQVRDELLELFRDLGFAIGETPEVELEENNFTRLAFPPDHPATDMQDTFWVHVDGAPADTRTLLRTHATPIQVREMMKHAPPLAVVSSGAVYRRDDDVTHSPMFHQIDGFLVDEHVTFADLKGVIQAFCERLYGRETQTRWRPSYFPFVEPGAEVDVRCVFCAGVGCRICKHTGWIEILGCGMIDPDVFRHCGVDPERYTGFAFGLGIDRVAMLRYGIPDIRLLFENDPRFLAQFS